MSELLNFLSKLETNGTDPRIAGASGSASPEEACRAISFLPQPVQTVDAVPENIGSVGLDEIASTLWRRRLVLFAFVASGLALAILLSLFSKPVYRARTAIRLQMPPDPYAAVAIQSPASDLEGSSTSESYVQNEIKVLQSDSLAERVADRIDEEVPEKQERLPLSSPLKKLLAHFKRPETSSPEQARIRLFHQALTVHTSLKSQVVEIYFDSADPLRAATAANAVVSEYIAMNREAEIKSAQDRTEWLSSQISDLKTKLDRENQDLKAFASASGLIYSTNQSALAEQRVSELQTQLTKAEAERAAMQSRYETAVSNAPESISEGADDTLLHEYEANLVEAEKDLSHLSSIYTPKNYKVTDAESRVAQIQASIQRERKSLIERLRTQYDSTVRLQSSIERAYRAQTQGLQSQSADVFRYNTLKHDLDTTQQLYDSLSQKIKEAEIASSLQTTNVRLIDAARPPATPYSPNFPLNAAIGSGLGILVGMVTILIRDRGTIPRGPGAQSRVLQLRELGSIPDASRAAVLGDTGLTPLAWKRDAPPLAMTTWHAQGPLTEAYSSTIASILFSPKFGKQHRTLTVTSVEPQEGKTTIIANLAILLAENLDRVLLIDADLRRPSLHRIFDACNDTGLTSLLASEEPIASVDLSRFLLATKVAGLFLLPSGPGVPSVTPLLRSPRMAEFLARAQQDFDWVLIDTPPTSLFSDARALGRLADSVILVFDEQRAHCDALTAACCQFAEDGTIVFGTIRNRAKVHYGRRTHEYYKGYGTP
jgi:polysaccharide biosynthesis transport protein